MHACMGHARCVFISPCFKERRDQRDLNKVGEQPHRVVEEREVRCQSRDGATTPKLYMPSDWQAGWYQRASSLLPACLHHARSAAFRDHSAPPNQTSSQGGIIVENFTRMRNPRPSTLLLTGSSIPIMRELHKKCIEKNILQQLPSVCKCP